MLRERGFGVETTENEPALFAALEGPVVAVVVDWDGPGGSALARAVMARVPDVPVVAVVRGDTSVFVEAVRAGVRDVLLEPLSPEAIERVLRAAMSVSEQTPPEPLSSGLLGASRPMAQVEDLIRRAAPGTSTVLIRGESGTGKEVVARVLHQKSPRAGGPFVKVHCAALPDALLESELFGYEKGAFTGAAARKPGRVEVAERGTMFLDEIGDITPAMQVKLLRLLQDREYERLGSTETRRADVRFVTATHRNLEAMVKRQEFREDLFYRLNVVPIWLPPLRTRHGDVELLAAHFCTVFGAANGRPGARLDDGALRVLGEQRWPGNVRQLSNFVERLVVLSDVDVVTASAVQRELADDEPLQMLSTQKGAPTEAAPPPPANAAPSTTGSPLLPLAEEVRRAERQALVRALRRAQGNRSLAARLLGVGRATLYKKMNEYGVE